MTTTEHSPTAKGSGSSATKAFRDSVAHGGAGDAVSPERVSSVVGAILEGVHNVVREHEVTYQEFQAAKQWLIDVGEGGEWPLFLDVFVEHAVEEVAARTQSGTKGSILGPYYLPNARRLPPVTTLPRRDDEKGEELVFAGRYGTLTAGRCPAPNWTCGRPTRTATTPASPRTSPRATCAG